MRSTVTLLLTAITVLNADGSVLQESPGRTGYAFVESPSRAGTARRVAGATLSGTAAFSTAARRRQVQISPYTRPKRKEKGRIETNSMYSRAPLRLDLY